MESEGAQCFVLLLSSIRKAPRDLVHALKSQVSGAAKFVLLSYQETGDYFFGEDKEFGVAVLVINRDYLNRTFAGCDAKRTCDPSWRVIPGNIDLVRLALFLHMPDYDHYWFSEDDVRYTGNWAKLIHSFYTCDSDLLVTSLRPMPDLWPFRNGLEVGPMSSITIEQAKEIAFLPVARASSLFFHALFAEYHKGTGGHFELVWPMLCRAADLDLRDLNSFGHTIYRSSLTSLNLNPGTFVFFPPRLFAGRSPDCLYHPVKKPLAFVASWWRHIVHRKNRIMSVVYYFVQKHGKARRKQ